jgi:hypothetical protein
MRQRFAIIVTIAIVLGILIALNTANYVETREQPDTELAPNRSTYNSGATGTRAFYDLLNEAGYKVMRWRETASVLLSENRAHVSTFVIIGTTLEPIEDDEIKNLLLWVKQGGRLVIIDRFAEKVLPKSGDWIISDEFGDFPGGVDPANTAEMTAGVGSIHPAQPTLLTRNVQSVRLSRFASVIKFIYAKDTKDAKPAEHGVVTIYPAEGESNDESPDEGKAPPPQQPNSGNKGATPVALSPAPVVHLSNSKGAVLVDYPHGAGRIVVLSDPYIVANGGIKLEDNLQLAINAVAGNQGLIAFDEYHQGRGLARNAMAAYFAGTPVLAICGQLTLLVLVILWTRGRRFGRALPLPLVDRRSSLEFVASMAELQQRAGALDLAIENIYSRTRRALTRYAGVDYHSSRAEIAERVASRSALNRQEVEALMRECEDTINGAKISERQSLALVKRLRAVEGALGLRMRSRDVKQAAEKL